MCENNSFADVTETQLFPAFGLNNTDWRIVRDRSQVPALREDEQAKYTMIAVQCILDSLLEIE